MELQELYGLMDRFAASGLSRLEWRTGGDEVVLCCDRTAAAVPAQTVPTAVAAPVQSAPASVQEGELVTAPLVGVFYAAPSPDAAPFVTPGQTVKQGQTLCILEAMKMMSEVPAPADCVVTEVLARDGEAVGFGQPLFRIRKV